MLPLLYVIGRNTWALKEDALALSDSLRRQFSITAPLVTTPSPVQNTLLHYINRYEYLDNADAGIHPSNRVLVTWYHGAPDDPDYAPMYTRLLGRVDEIERIITSCQSTRQHLLTAGIPDTKIAVIPLGVDLARYRQPSARGRAELGIPVDAVCIGSFQTDGLGNDEGDAPKLIKGPDVFLDVIARLYPREPRLFVLLTGHQRGYVKAGLRQIGVPFAHHNFATHADTAACFRAADLILIASREEGGPKAFTEAWAAGIPVISTRMGMPADHVIDGENGLLANVDDAVGLAAAVQQLIAQPELRARIVAGGTQAVAALTWDIIAARHMAELYQAGTA